MRGAEAIDEYIALPQQEAFDIEYWLLEEAKLKRMPAEKELARQVIIVIGAGCGIGKETAHRLVKEGAHIVCVDLKPKRAEATAKEITDKLRPGHRRRGHRHLRLRPGASASRANITDRASIRAMLDQVALAYGGFDSICVTAGVFCAERHHRPHPRRQVGASPSTSMSPAATSSADEAARPGKSRACAGTLVLTTSANAAVAKKGSVAYDTLEGRREPPRARTGHRARAARARQRRRAGDRRARQRDVPARPRHRLAREIQHPLHGRRSDRIAGHASSRNSTPTAR